MYRPSNTIYIMTWRPNPFLCILLCMTLFTYRVFVRDRTLSQRIFIYNNNNMVTGRRRISISNDIFVFPKRLHIIKYFTDTTALRGSMTCERKTVSAHDNNNIIVIHTNKTAKSAPKDLVPRSRFPRHFIVPIIKEPMSPADERTRDCRAYNII